MTCQRYVAWMSAYLDEGLEIPLALQLETHLGTCEGCQEELATMKGLSSSARAVAKGQGVPAGQQTRTEQTGRRPLGPTWMAIWRPMAASVVTVLVALVVAAQWRESSWLGTRAARPGRLIDDGPPYLSYPDTSKWRVETNRLSYPAFARRPRGSTGAGSRVLTDGFNAELAPSRAAFDRTSMAKPMLLSTIAVSPAQIAQQPIQPAPRVRLGWAPADRSAAVLALSRWMSQEQRPLSIYGDRITVLLPSAATEELFAGLRTFGPLLSLDGQPIAPPGPFQGLARSAGRSMIQVELRLSSTQ